tara:strand:+ start:166 stop:1941 length:1776 start_codon:yes stop_codon:yes gene_type:complete
MKCTIKLCFFIFLIFTIKTSFAQDSTITRFVSLTNTKDTLVSSVIDLDDFQSYRFKHTPFLASSGNIGLPTMHLDQVNLPSYNGFFQGYSSSLLTKEGLKFYNQEKDVTLLQYTNGAQSEQYFKVFHSNQFGEGLNLSFDYNRIISQGFYVNQLTDNTHFNSTLNYNSRNDKYHLKIGYLISNIKTQENGGVNYSDSTDENINSSTLVPFNLSSATHHLRSQTVVLDQSFLIADSSFFKQVKLYHQLDMSWSWKRYKDLGGQEFYEKFYIDSSSTFDSINYSKVSNSFGFSILDNLIRLDYSYEFHDYYQNSTFDTLYTSQFINASLFKQFGKLSAEFNFKQGISGFNQNDFDQNLNLRYDLDSNNKVLLALKNTRLTPYYWQNRFSGNHVFYIKQFDDQDKLFARLSFVNKHYNYSLGIEVDQSSNLIVYNSSAEPFQYSKSVNRILVNLRKNFDFGNFQFNNDLNYQYIDNLEVLPLPSIFTSHSLFYQNSFFEEKLFTQIGVDARYIGNYDGYGYFPESSVFTIQDQRELGDFVYLDVFIKFRIQHVRVFAKMENLLGNQFEPKGMMINNYGIPGRVFKIGLSWAMFN